MTSTIYGFIDYSSKIKVYDIFGYSTNGIPGVELVLPSKVARQFQQKLVFMTRKNKLKIPMKRFVMGVDADFDSVHASAIKQLELPFLILYWSMANIIKLPKTENCLTSGEFGINGKIKFNQDYCSWLAAVDQVSEEYFGNDLTLIGEWPRASELPYPKILLNELFDGIKSTAYEPVQGMELRNQACLPDTDPEE